MSATHRPALALLLGTALALLLAEAGARLLWPSAPDHLSPVELQARAADGTVVGRGRYERYRINPAGYRGPPLRPPGDAALRIAVLGDSFVYGVGVHEDDALPARLGAALAARGLDAEVLNGGVPGANLERGLARVSTALLHHAPGLVLYVLLWNDLDLAGPEARYGAGLDGSRFTGRGSATLLGRLADALLPVPPSPAPGAPPPGPPSAAVQARYRLANLSRAYAFAALQARARGTAWGAIDRELTLLHVDTPAIQAAAWGRLQARIHAAAAEARAAGVPFGVVHFMDGPLAGLPALRLREALDATGVPVLDLSPLWGDYAAYTAHHTLGYDSHPNRAALARAGATLATWVHAQGWAPGLAPAPDAAPLPDAAAWRAAQAPRAAAQRAQLDALAATFGPTLGDATDPAARAREANQWLLGWEATPDGRRSLRAPGDDTLPAGSVWLRAPAAGATTLTLDAEPSPGADLAASVACGPAAAARSPAQPVPRRAAALTFPLDPPVPAGALVECRLHLAGRAAAHGGGLTVRRVALGPGPGPTPPALPPSP